MAELTYKEQIDAKRILMIREIIRDLPSACFDFISSITATTGTFTRLAYALDLRTFFQYLQRERAAFANKELYQFTDTDLAAIGQRDLVAYIDYLTLYYKSDPDNRDALDLNKPLVNHELAIKRKLCSLRTFFEYLFMNNRVPSNVTQLVALPQVHEKPIIRLNESEMARILEVARNGDEQMSAHQKGYHKNLAVRDFAILTLFLGTGIRVSELVGLNIEDFNMEERQFLVTRKGGNQVILYFPEQVRTALEEYLDERVKIEPLPGHEGALFLSTQRKRINQRSIQLLVKKYAAIAAPLQKRISPHKLRSTFATNLYGATGDIYLVADVLGHSSVDTTRKHYADQREENRRNAANYVKLGLQEPNDEHQASKPLSSASQSSPSSSDDAE